MLELINVSRTFKNKNNKVLALSNVTLKLPNTGLIALVGENGCGKTTLLNVLSTIDSDYSGAVFYNGQDIRNIFHHLRQEIISYVFQEKQFVSKLTVFENIELFSDDDSETRKELEKFDIPEKENELPQNLSGGQKQRVSLIRGLLKKSRILLVDEPTSAMNEAMEKTVFERLKRLSDTKLVVVVSHNLPLIKYYADLIVCMDKGRIVKVEKNITEDIRYEDNCAYVPLNTEKLDLLDTNFIKRNLREKREIRIRVTDENQQKRQLDYSDNEPVQKPGINCLKHKTRNNLRRRFLKINVLKKVLLIVAMAGFTGFVALAANIKEFNPNVFTYNSLKKNIATMIPFADSSGYFQWMYDFNYQNAGAVIKQYTEDFIYLNQLPEKIKLGYSVNNFYSDSISGIAMYKSTDCLPLAYGTYPKAGACLITDFLADSICYFSDEPIYEDYNEILDRGLTAGGRHFNISGIIKTEYRDYISKLGAGIDSGLFENRRKYFFCNLFYSLEETLKSGVIPVCRCENSTVLFSVKTDDATLSHTCEIDSEMRERFEKLGLSDKPTVYLNDTLLELVGLDNYCFYFENHFGDEFYVIEGTVSDNEKYPVAYIQPNEMNKFIEEYFDVFSNILVDVNSIELIDYLEKCGLRHDSACSESIYSMIEMVDYSLSPVILFQKISIVIITLLLLTLIAILLGEDKLAIAFLRINDVSAFDIYFFEACKMLFCTLLSAVLSVGVMALLQRGINAFFSAKEYMIIPLISLSMKNALLAVTVLFCGMLLISVVTIFIHRRRKLLKLLN